MRDLRQNIRLEQIVEVLRRLLTRPQALSQDTTLTASNTTTSVDASAAAVTITLPLASQHVSRVYSIKKIDASANAVTITPSGADTIDGAATYSLAAQWDSVTLVSDGSQWLKLGGTTAGSGGGSTVSGTATLDFGGSVTSENDVTSVVVPDAGIGAASEVTASLHYAATADHTADEVLISGVLVVPGSITAGVGFTIYGYAPEGTWGKYTIHWVRN